ncbi:hypothetical protein T484DRAFT_1860543 [Baffinella frigidus]|nr:hypothetical protein T484DRAFT_1860543 [Cryptophyta sp. CCMP2293]
MQGRATAAAGEFKPQEITTLMWALAKIGVDQPDAGLLEAMQDRAKVRVGDFKPQEIANLMWALAVMGITPEAKARRFDGGRVQDSGGQP